MLNKIDEHRNRRITKENRIIDKETKIKRKINGEKENIGKKRL